MKGRPRKIPGEGHTESDCGLIKIAIRLDKDTFHEVRQMAETNRVSFAEAARLLIEWGLEEGKNVP